jgi:hypothetical protein
LARNVSENLHTYSELFNLSSSVVGVAVAIGIGAIFVAPVQSQNIGLGEKRFNAAIYKGSHNSYSRDESLAQQIDDYDVWQIELDVYDYRGDLKVNHTCDAASVANADTLETLLSKMVADSKTYFHRFTVIYVDMKECSIANWGQQIKDRMKNAFARSLGIAHIYPAAEFTDRDHSEWPSYQELVRRGYYWGVIVDWHGEVPRNAALDDMLFYATSINPPDENALSLNTVLVNVDGGCDASSTSVSAAPSTIAGDCTPRGPRDCRWLYRLWPNTTGSPAGCYDDCQSMNDKYWQNGTEKGYNFVATNCVNWNHTFEPPIHSPNPLFVDQFARTNCPEGYSTCEWGTLSFPYHILMDAITRASPMVTLFIRGGQYQVTTPSAPCTIKHPMILTASDDGSVVMH